MKGGDVMKDGNIVYKRGTDSSVRVWQKNNATLDTNLSPNLLKVKIQLETGVEMDASHNIETIPSKEYFKLKEEFTKEEKKVQAF